MFPQATEVIYSRYIHKRLGIYWKRQFSWLVSGVVVSPLRAVQCKKCHFLSQFQKFERISTALQQDVTN